MDLSSILYFYTKDCEMCKAFESALKKFENKHEGELTRVDVEENEETKALFGSLAEGVCPGVPFMYNQENGKHICGTVHSSEIDQII